MNAQVHEKHGSSPPSGFMSMGGEVPSHESHGPSVDSVTSFRRSLEYSGKKLNLRKSRDRVPRRTSAAAGESAAPLRIIKLSQICYLLISPLLPPISLFATMFSKLDDHQDLRKTNAASPAPSIPPHDGLTHSENILVNHPTLAIYGTKDFFASQRKLRQWAENLTSQQHSLFRFREISGAGHFWQESGVEKELRCAIREWLQDIEGLQEDVS
jgi:pimeloyl-ACP methyl ester carboxylesterase